MVQTPLPMANLNFNKNAVVKWPKIGIGLHRQRITPPPPRKNSLLISYHQCLYIWVSKSQYIFCMCQKCTNNLQVFFNFLKLIYFVATQALK